jgi:hyperosmotically inducible periplasmic protein
LNNYCKTQKLFKMKLTKLLMAVAVLATLTFVSCKPKDTAIKASIEAALKADPMMTNTTVDVKDGVATISGECKDDACKAMCEKTVAGIKGVKSVSNNCTVTPPPPPPPVSVTTTLDAKVMQAIKDGLKDIKGVTVDFAGAQPALMGEVSAANRMKIMQIFASAKIVPDVTKLVTKK